MAKAFLTMQEVTLRSGVAASALRYYQERGLIHADRSGSGQRQFQRSVLRRIAFIIFAQRVGLSLYEIKQELDKLPQDHVPDGEDWAKIAETWSARIDERIDEMQRLKNGLTDCISCGCLSLAQCKLVNPGDGARELGPGPRYWVGARDMKKLLP